MKPKISVVIPIFNRKANLRRVFASLDRQDFRDFEVVVTDDGSTDNPVESLSEFSDRLELKYRWQPNMGFRGGQVRNEGVKMAMGEVIVFIDSDVMINPAALSHYWSIYTANPDAFIVGRYDWLPPMDFSVHDVYTNWDRIITGKMPSLKKGKLSGIVGTDPRAENKALFNSADTRKKYCLSVFGGNILISKKIFWAIGGFDEMMVGHGGEDCEFAISLQKSGHQAIFSDEVVGYHIYHDRDVEKNKKEVMKNIEYIAKKHDLDELGIRLGNVEEGELPLVLKEGVKDYV